MSLTARFRPGYEKADQNWRNETDTVQIDKTSEMSNSDEEYRIPHLTF